MAARDRQRASICTEPGCPTITARARCTEHERERDRQRGTRQQRGYDAEHDRNRELLAPLVATGQVLCWRCREPIRADEPWDLGHDDQDRSITRGPEHANRCNRSAGGRAAHPGA